MNALELVETLVNVPSVSGGEAPLADLLCELLRREGFAVQREGDSVWFTLGCRERPHLLLVSHIDTVPPCDGWTGDPFKMRREGDKLIGLGANDAKGCVAAMILAARRLESDETVTFAFVAEEERSGAGIRAVKTKLPHIDAAIVGEPTALEVCTSQRGMLLLRCVAHGVAAHAAHAELGDNAIQKAARDIARLPANAQVTQIAGGVARNQVPDRCEFFVDIRTTTDAEPEIPALESEVLLHSSRYVPVATEESEPIVRAALEAANRARGIDSVTTSDWAFLNGIPAVKVGPGDTNRSHRPNEYLLPSELEAGAAFYARAVRAYFKQMKAHV
jgi:acetylornithine deacetylase